MARAICVALHPEGREMPPELKNLEKRRAFITRMCARIEHLPGGSASHARVLAEAEICQDGRRRGHCRTFFREDGQPHYDCPVFRFTPAVIEPTELLLRGTLLRLTDSELDLPPRPTFPLPARVTLEGIEFVSTRLSPGRSAVLGQQRSNTRRKGCYYAVDPRPPRKLVLARVSRCRRLRIRAISATCGAGRS